MFRIKFTLEAGSKRYDVAATFNAAMTSVEWPVQSAVRVEISGPTGRVWLYRLKGW